MDIDTMSDGAKAQFVKAFQDKFGFGVMAAASNADAAALMGAAAWAWQASRESVIVELPKPHYEFEGDPAPEMFASQVIAAIKAQGLRVKP